MRKILSVSLVAGVLALTFVFSPTSGFSRAYGPPPVVAFPGEPEMVVVPGTYVYFAPGVNEDLFFYHDYWYRPYEGRWYRARSYNGPWAFIERTRVPRVFFQLPPDYRRMDYRARIPYPELRRNWRAWEHERHWDRPEAAREHREGEREYEHHDRDREHRD